MKNKIFTFSLLLIFSFYLFPMERPTGKNDESPCTQLLTLYQSGNIENTKKYFVHMNRTELTKLLREIRATILIKEIEVIDLAGDSNINSTSKAEYKNKKAILKQLNSIHTLICQSNKFRK